MIIKDAKKYSFEETGQKKNKPKRATRNPLVIIEDDDETQVSLPTRTKGGKKKRSVEGNNAKERKKKKNWKSTLESAASTDLPSVTQSCSDSGSINEAEKLPKALKKKRKRHSCEQDGNPELLSRGQTTECQEANLLVGKKRRRSVSDTCVEFTASPTKRKKKKKCKLAGSVSPSHGEDDYSRNYLPPTMETVSHERMLSDRKQTLIQNAGSKGKNKPMCCLASADSQGPRKGVLKRVAANPVQEENSCERDHRDTAHVLKKKRQTTEQKKKRKKLKEKEADFVLTSVGNQENRPAKPLQKTKSEEKQEETGRIQNSEGDRKSLKKKKTYPKVTDHRPPLAEGHEDAFDREEKAAAIKRAKKKAKKAKKERDQAVILKSGHLRERKDKHRDATKRKSGRSKGLEEAPSSKRAKVKKEAEEEEDEIQVVAIKKGNCDEVRIDKLRRQALQEEIDRESSKTETIKEEDDSDHCFGQWSTATFDSAEQKSKFLKLLGGFKKGAAPPREWPAKARQHNMALGRHGEEKLQQSLQAEFEKAMDWKQRRGTGLGFQPAPQKRVYIDKYASKSIKFEN